MYVHQKEWSPSMHVSPICLLQLHASALPRPHDLTCQVCEKQLYSEDRFFKHIHKHHPEYWRVFSGGRPLTDFIGMHEVKHRGQAVQLRGVSQAIQPRNGADEAHGDASGLEQLPEGAAAQLPRLPEGLHKGVIPVEAHGDEAGPGPC